MQGVRRTLDPTVLRHVWVASALSLVLISAISVVDYIATHDGPNAIVHGYLALHLDDADKGYAHFLKPSPSVTNLGFNAPFTMLLRFLPWKEALQVTLCLGALVWSWGFFALIAATEPRRLGLAPFGFATALSWSFYMGFYSYWIASGLALLLFAFAVASPRWDTRRLAWLSAGVLLIALAHSFVALLVGVVLALLTLVRSPSKERLGALVRLGIAGVPGMVVAILSSSGSSEPLVKANIRAAPLASTWLNLADLIALPARCFAGGPIWRGAVPPLLALVGLGWVVVRVRRAETSLNDRALALAALVLLVLSLLLPFHFQLWNYFSPRFLPFWATLGIALLPIERLTGKAARAAVHALGIAFALCALFWSISYEVALAEYEADGIALANAPLKRTGARLPLKLNAVFDGIAYDDPGLNIPMLYVIEQGGMVPDLFATRAGIHPHVYRAPPEKLFPKFPGRFYGELFRAAGSDPHAAPKPVQLAWLALLGAAYEDVILISDVEDADAIIARGYVVDKRRGKAAILRYAGCGLKVVVATASELHAPLLIEYGWTPILQNAGRHVVSAGTAAGSVEASFPAAPCGPVWVRVTWDNDHSGEPSPGDTYCRESNPMHLVDSMITKDHNAVVCTPPAVSPDP